MAKPPITVTKLGNSGEFLARIKGIGKIATYVGIPAGSSSVRNATALNKAKKIKNIVSKKSRRRKEKLSLISAFGEVSNAQLLYWFSKGSPLRGQPGRPVLEAAIHAHGNKEPISALVAEAVAADLAGRHYLSQQLLKKAGALAAKVSRDWFTDSRNNWAPNSYNTLRRKHGDTPGIDTDIMRQAITHIEKEI